VTHGLRIDHVLYGVDDLGAASEGWFARYGLASVPGGRHVGHGTANRVVPLGQTYLELIAVVDETEAASSAMGLWIEAQIGAGERWVGWCVATDDIEGLSERLGLTPVVMQRRRPDGRVLSWRLAGLEIAMTEPFLPFFIQWDVSVEDHPGRATATHRRTVSGITAVELSADRRRLSEWLGDHNLPLRFVDGEEGIRAVALSAYPPLHIT
jgi:hypothetical protein